MVMGGVTVARAGWGMRVLNCSQEVHGPDGPLVLCQQPTLKVTEGCEAYRGSNAHRGHHFRCFERGTKVWHV